MKEGINILFGLDCGYWDVAALAATSLVRNLSPQTSVQFFFLFEGVSIEKRTRLDGAIQNIRRDAAVTWIEVGENVASSFPATQRFPRGAFFRVLAPRLLPDSVEWVLYLDGDVIVADDVSELFGSLEGRDFQAAACLDAYMPSFKHRIDELRYSGHTVGPWVQQDVSRAFVNSGVMLINLERWRSELLAERVLAFFRACPRACPLPDQDAINATLDSIEVMDPKWNVQMGAPGTLQCAGSSASYGDHTGASFDQLILRPGIVHFAGNKPWTGLVPGRSSRRGTAEHFYWNELRRSGLYSNFEFAALRLRLLTTGLVRLAKEMRYKGRHRRQFAEKQNRGICPQQVES